MELAESTSRDAVGRMSVCSVRFAVDSPQGAVAVNGSGVAPNNGVPTGLALF